MNRSIVEEEVSLKQCVRDRDNVSLASDEKHVSYRPCLVFSSPWRGRHIH